MPWSDFPPFNDGARRLLEAARDESDRLRHEYVGTEHVLLGMTATADGGALLARLGVEPARVRESIASIIQPGSGDAPSSVEQAVAVRVERPYTSRTRDALVHAAECAHALGHEEIGIEHLLVGLLRERKNIGAQVLHQLGVTEERALERLVP
jgi:ATP-dependent Clp protease ATP-binding subunit ClpC